MKREDMIARIIALKPCYEDEEIYELFAGADDELNELDVIQGAIKAGVDFYDVVWLGIRLLPRPLVLRFAQGCDERRRAYDRLAPLFSGRLADPGARTELFLHAVTVDAARALGAARRLGGFMGTMEERQQLAELVALAEEHTR